MMNADEYAIVASQLDEEQTATEEKSLWRDMQVVRVVRLIGGQEHMREYFMMILKRKYCLMGFTWHDGEESTLIAHLNHIEYARPELKTFEEKKAAYVGMANELLKKNPARCDTTNIDEMWSKHRVFTIDCSE